MTVVNMMGTDHLPLGRTWTKQEQIDYEGLDLMDKIGLTAAYFTAIEANGRTWLAAWHTTAGPYGNLAQRSAQIISAKPLREVFGNPEVVTKGTLAFRLYIDAAAAARWASAASNNNCALFVGSTIADGQILTALPVGEHFLEFTFDFVNKQVRSYLNGTLFNTSSNSGLTLDTTISLGLHAYHAQTSSLTMVGGMNDFYITYDNQDGSVSGRLGSVKVLPMPFDQVDMPASWGFEEDPAQFYTYNLVEGGTWDAHQIIPKTTTELAVKGQFTHSSVPVVSAGNLQTILTESGQYMYWTGVSDTMQIIITTSFERAKKVSGYALMSYIAGYGIFNNWKFQASNDGTNWVDLDTRSNQQSTLGAASYVQLAYKIPADKVGLYKHYRLNVTGQANQGSSRCSLRHYQLLGEVADVKANTMPDALTRPANNAGGDMDFPVIRADLNSSDAIISFKTPDTGTSDILAVRVSAIHRREQGVNEVLTYRQRVGSTDGAPREVTLKAHAERLARVATYRQSPDNTDWTKEKLADFRLVVNSKRGA